MYSMRRMPLYFIAVFFLGLLACTPEKQPIPGEECTERQASQTVDVSHRYRLADGSMVEADTGEPICACAACSRSTSGMLCRVQARNACSVPKETASQPAWLLPLCL